VRLAKLGRTHPSDPGAITSLEQWCNVLAKIPLEFHPGTAWLYGYGHDVAGRVLEVVSGEPLDALLRRRLLSPLGMSNTSFSLRFECAKRCVGLYMRSGGKLVRVSDARPSKSSWLASNASPILSGGGGVEDSSGGLVSTSHDFTRFCLMLLNRGEIDGQRILNSESVAFLTSNQLPHVLGRADVWCHGTPGLGFSALGLTCEAHADILGYKIGDFGSINVMGSSWTANHALDLLIFNVSLVVDDEFVEEALREATQKALVRVAAEPTRQLNVSAGGERVWTMAALRLGMQHASSVDGAEAVVVLEPTKECARSPFAKPSFGQHAEAMVVSEHERQPAHSCLGDRAAARVVMIIRRFLALRSSMLLVCGGDECRTMFGASLIHCASSMGNASLVQYWSRDPAQRESVNLMGQSPLVVVARKGHLQVLICLCTAQADVESKDLLGETALIKSARAGHDHVVQHLCRLRAQINAVDAKGRTALFAASEAGHASIVHRMVIAGASREAVSDDDDTTLSTAAKNGHLEVIRCLCAAVTGGGSSSGERFYSMGTCINMNVLAKNGVTPLCAAASEGHVEVVVFLLRRRASPDMPVVGNASPSLLAAASAGHLHILRLLCDARADLDASRSDGITPFIAAVAAGFPEVVRCLVSCGASVNKAQTNGWTALMCASHLGHNVVAELLLNAKADVEHGGPDGIQAFDAAVAAGHLNVVSSLCSKKADIHGNFTRSTPLATAASNGHVGIMRLLIGARAEPNRPGRDGRTALLAAVRGGHLPVIDFLGDIGSVKRHSSPEGDSALVRAAFDNQLDIVQALVRARASVNEAQRNGGFVPSHAAVTGGHLEILRYLLESRASLHCFAKNGENLMTNAAWHGHEEMFHFLQRHPQGRLS